MTAVIRHNLRVAAAKAVLQQIESNQARFSYFLGKVDPFLDSNGAVVTSETPVATPQYDGQIRADLVLVKNITSADVSLVVPRINWVSGTVYDQWDVTVADTTRNYYCLVEETMNVYKCIRSPGTDSTVQPSGTGQENVSTADGYIWKFIYNIPLALRNKFMTSALMPVSNSLGVRHYSSGSLEAFRIINQGSSLNANNITCVVTGDGSDAIVKPIVVAGELVNLTIENAGTGYTWANLAFTGDGVMPQVDVIIKFGDSFSAQALVENFAVPGSINDVSVTFGGFDVSGTAVTFQGDGTGASATATLSGGAVTSVTIDNPGSGYTWAKPVFASAATAPTAVAQISPPLGHGRDVINELGANSLMFYSTLGQNKVGGATIDTSYKQFGIIKDVRAYGTYNSQYAEMVSESAVMVKGIFNGAQWPIGGAVSWPGGSGVILQKIIGSLENGLILQVNSGSISVGTTITYSIYSFVTTSAESQSVFQGSIGSACFVGYGAFDNNIEELDIFTHNSNSFRVVSKTNSNVVLLPLNTNATLNHGDTITKQGSGASYQLTTVTTPTIDKRSGEILFVDNRLPFNQTSDQVVTFRSVIRF